MANRCSGCLAEVCTLCDRAVVAHNGNCPDAGEVVIAPLRWRSMAGLVSDLHRSLGPEQWRHFCELADRETVKYGTGEDQMYRVYIEGRGTRWLSRETWETIGKRAGWTK